MLRPHSALSLYAAGGQCELTTANFPFLANSYYWDGTVNAGVTAMLEAMGGPSYDPSGTLLQTTNGVNIGNTSFIGTTLDLSRIAANDNLLLWIAGKPDFLTTTAGITIGSSTAGILIAQNATQTIFTVSDIDGGGFSHTVTVANNELQDQVCAIMVKNPTGSSITADYYIVAADDSTVTTGALTSGGAIATLAITPSACPVAVSKYTSGTGVLRAFGLFSLATVPSANDLKGFLAWMHWNISTNARRDMYPHWKGVA